MIESIDVTDPVVQLITIALGVAILVAGRRLFWLTVGVLGFIVALGLAFNFMGGQPEWLILVVALVAGVLGAVVAIFLQQIAFSIAGFLAGGYLSVWLLDALNIDLEPWDFLIFVVGGLIGVLIVAVLLEYALIVLTSLTGAVIISQNLNFSPWLTWLLLAILVTFGIMVQLRTLHPTSRPRKRQSRG